ncbi:MarR family transcriptional regulator [Erythrobacter sp. KY5]|uniref:winged helix DNA-binding protein n=1 Tax=Erythrobacter sp. KY5 TaxID=2011159 RepID=UPI000DBF00DE|nr:winged helix DNA-binding protein [Erythrobacter sp. KY5]AWW74686.1 MarR family transcriptional regulator [Erythrobacter sp. KY5]
MKEGTDNRFLAKIAARERTDMIRQEANLSELARQLRAIAETLSAAETSETGIRRTASLTGVPSLDHARIAGAQFDAGYGQTNGLREIQHLRTIYAEFAREAYTMRRRRGTIFDNQELFGEPAWDILLDLYIAHVENKTVSVSSACIGSAAPPTTGLRWLGVLTEEGLIVREHDPEDQRRVLVRLTERGLAAMDEHFASAGPSA